MKYEEVKGANLDIGDWVVFDPDSLMFNVFYIVTEKTLKNIIAKSCNETVNYNVFTRIALEATVYKCEVPEDRKERARGLK
jgi:hypothetical protein